MTPPPGGVKARSIFNTHNRSKKNITTKKKRKRDNTDNKKKNIEAVEQSIFLFFASFFSFVLCNCNNM